MDCSIIYRILLVFLIISFSHVNAIEFQGKFIQGHFILGQTDPNAKIIIGPHGAAFSNIIFSNPGLHLFELIFQMHF